MLENMRSLADLAEQIKKDQEEADKVPYQRFLDNFVDLVKSNNNKVVESINAPQSNENNEYVCLKEPIEFLDLFQACNGQDECLSLFKKLLDSRDARVIQQVIRADKIQTDLWFNSTGNGINLRPGLKDEAWSSPNPVLLGDDVVHALVAGRTGSGKSVFLNSVIFSLMAEYAPWELDLYLVDFKKVEFSRYLSKYEVPHIKTVAATSEIRYVVSLLTYLANCMKARQDFFSALGLKKIIEIRKEFNIVLPRVLLIVDEFQQLFLESTNKEQMIIQDLLTSITKLGRATGYHLMFASQEMSGTLGSSVLGNFKARFALACSPEVSGAILGNSAASKIEKKGIVISSIGEGNDTFKVPFISNEYFYDFLVQITEKANEFGFNSVHKFYQEDSISDFGVLESLLDDILDTRSALINKSSSIFDIITLGEAVVFNYKKFDYETVFLERGVRKNIGVFSPSVDDTAYVCKLLATNFLKSPRAKEYKHYLLVRNDLFLKKYDIGNDIKPLNSMISSPELIDAAISTFKKRKREALLINSYSKDTPLEDFAYEAFCLRTEYIANLNEESKKSLLDVWSTISGYFKGYSVEDIPHVKEKIFEDYEFDDSYFRIIDLLYKKHVENLSTVDLFEPNVIWIIGCEMIGKFSSDFINSLQDSLAYNMLFILVASNIEFNDFYMLQKSCDYLFVSGNNEAYYNKMHMPFTRKSEGSLAIDFSIVSTSTQRSFKKFKYDLSEVIVPEIDFDSILKT